MRTQLDMYIAKQGELVKEYDGRIIALQDGEVLGVYPTKLAALRAMQAANYQPGTFMIIKCTPGDEEYTATFHSRVEFKQTGIPLSEPCQP